MTSKNLNGVKMRKIPIMRLLSVSLNDVLGNFKTVIRLSIFVILVNVSVIAIFGDFKKHNKNAETAEVTTPNAPPPVGQILKDDYTKSLEGNLQKFKKDDDINLPPAINLALIIFNIITYASMAVSWHKLIILKEQPTNFFHIPPVKNSFKYILAYALIAVVLFILFIIPVTALIFLIKTIPALLIPSILAGIFMAIWIFGFGYRISLKLPIVAINNEEVTISQSLKLTEGNTIRLGVSILLLILIGFVIALVFMLPGMLVGLALSILGKNLFPLLIISVTAICISLGQIVNIFFGISILSNMYKFFINGENFEQ